VSDGAGTAATSAPGNGTADGKADAGPPQNATDADNESWSATTAAGPNGVAPATDEKTRCVLAPENLPDDFWTSPICFIVPAQFRL